MNNIKLGARLYLQATHIPGFTRNSFPMFIHIVSFQVKFITQIPQGIFFLFLFLTPVK